MKEYFEGVLDSIVTAAENKTQFNSCLTVVDLKHYPKHLYKYRDCRSEYNFEMLEEGYLWADLPVHFCDGVFLQRPTE